MNWFNLNYIGQAHFLFIVLLGVYHFLLKKQTHFRFNRKYLLLIGIVSLIIPLINIPIVSSTIVNIPYTETAINVKQNPAGTYGAVEKSTWSFIINHVMDLYLSIVSLLLLLLALKIAKIRKQVKNIKRNAQFSYIEHVYVSKEDIEPFTFFHDSFIPEKLLNRKDSDLIIYHERTHAIENHSIDIIIAEVINCLLFLNPFKKIYLQHLQENHEYLADATVTQNKPSEQYTSLLIDLTLKKEGLQIVSFFAKPSILNRLDMMNRTKKSRTNQIIASFCTVLMLSLFACDFQEEEIVMKEVPAEVNNSISSQDLKNQVFTIVEDQAEPVGGIQKYYDNIKDYMNGKYPQIAQDMGIEGIVFIQFIIETDGSVSDVQPVKGIGGGCDELAVKAVQSVGKWQAGMQNGKVVRTQRIIPIRFVLESNFLDN